MESRKTEPQSTQRRMPSRPPPTLSDEVYNEIEQFLSQNGLTPYKYLRELLQLVYEDVVTAKSLIDYETENKSIKRDQAKRLNNLIKSIKDLDPLLKDKLARFVSLPRYARTGYVSDRWSADTPPSKDFEVNQISDTNFETLNDHLLSEMLGSIKNAAEEARKDLFEQTTRKRGRKALVKETFISGAIDTYFAAGYTLITTGETSDFMKWVALLEDQFKLDLVSGSPSRWIRKFTGNSAPERAEFSRKRSEFFKSNKDTLPLKELLISIKYSMNIPSIDKLNIPSAQAGNKRKAQHPNPPIPRIVQKMNENRSQP